ncbi:DEAD/DEAH box helicase [Corynebacterium matruchotii]|uniref:DEAD/DEAH box helicase n=1 Tax=Corynebacterium matruchotii TaxID=43768 RepID=UPI0028E78BFB|nr:DEAD/DEAH box helicase [Corynebacterium matruchotii]
MGTATHLIHGFWQKQSGLHLWIEQVDGHKIVTGSGIIPGTFPPVIEELIMGKRYRHRVDMHLMTPKGRERKLPVPTIACTPEQAVPVLAAIAAIVDDAKDPDDPAGSPQATPEQCATLAPDLLWLAHMYRGLTAFARAGRVTIKLGFFERQWYPTWQLAAGLGERGWLVSMTKAAPGVITINGGPTIVEDIADELLHWIVNSLISAEYHRPRPTPWHDFAAALVESNPLRRGGATLVSALNKWRDSIAAIDVQLVLMIEEPDPNPDLESAGGSSPQPIWPIRVQVRSGVDAPMPIHPANFDHATNRRITALRREAQLITPYLNPDRPDPDSPLVAALRNVDNAGDWDVYLTTDELLSFINDAVPRLRERGIIVMLPRMWRRQAVTAHMHLRDEEATAAPQLGLDHIVAFDWRVSIGDIDLTDKEMSDLVAAKSGLINLRGEWVLADAASIRSISQYMEQLRKSSTGSIMNQLKQAKQRLAAAKTAGDDTAEIERTIEELTAALDNPSSGEISLKELRELNLTAETTDPIAVTGHDWQVSLIGGAIRHELPAPRRIPIPAGVTASLREYQRRGVDWMYWMARQGLGAVLADDMGLGKTLQLLALEAAERDSSEREPTTAESAGQVGKVGPSLVIAPTSVVGNWAREAKKFTPHLKILVHHGTERKKDQEFLGTVTDYDIVITSYGVASRDYQLLGQQHWHRVTLDEAQHIKNSSTKISKAVRSLPADHRMALTGTPVENRLLELRAILDFCNPGILGSVSFFKHHFSKPIEVTGDEKKQEQLRNLTAPFILRRLKSDPAIIGDFPEKTETVITVDLTKEQAALYTAYVNDLTTQLEQAEGIGRRGLVLASLTKIKQICNHPAHFLGDGSPMLRGNHHRSGKVEELMQIVENARDHGEKVLIFTQYKAFGDMLTPYLSDYYGQKIPFLHGGVSKSGRDIMVQQFQAPDGAPAMVLSLKAGGTGLNLTAANIVVHMDRWWNPAVENQATDRAYRIGQDKNVFVYKLITAGTVEERIHDIISGKSELAAAMIAQGEGWLTELSDAELATLLSYREME